MNKEQFEFKLIFGRIISFHKKLQSSIRSGTIIEMCSFIQLIKCLDQAKGMNTPNCYHIFKLSYSYWTLEVII